MCAIASIKWMETAEKGPGPAEIKIFDGDLGQETKPVAVCKQKLMKDAVCYGASIAVSTLRLSKNARTTIYGLMFRVVGRLMDFTLAVGE